MTEHDDRRGTRATERIHAHEESMKGKLEVHTARGEERLQKALVKTSDAIGKAARFVKEHSPETVGRHVEGIATRAQAALDDDKS